MWMTSLFTSQTLCQWIFSQWAIKELFIDENDSVREWWFRSWLDRYVSNKLSVDRILCSLREFLEGWTEASSGWFSLSEPVVAGIEVFFLRVDYEHGWADLSSTWKISGSFSREFSRLSTDSYCFSDFGDIMSAGKYSFSKRKSELSR